MAAWRRRCRYARLRKEEPELVDFLVRKLGVYPGRLDFYRVAFTHRGAPLELKSGFKVTNERLEYLGDAVLELAVSDFLFHRYPLREEGYLTQLRSCIVCRKSFNSIAERLGLDDLAVHMSGGRSFSMRMKGDALEAFFGALYLDVGFETARRAFVMCVLREFVNMEKLESDIVDPKSRVYIWARKNGVAVSIDTDRDFLDSSKFLAKVLIDGNVAGQGSARSKKLAEQAACEQVCEALAIGAEV